MEVIIGISGASGVCYGIRLLEMMRDCVTHLIMTENARRIIEIEALKSPLEVEKLANHCYSPYDFTAAIASGSYLFDAMVIAPCSMRTLAGIAVGLSDTLIIRVADICLKERRNLVLLTREMPLSLVHLKNMVSVTEAGAIVMPACPPFYTLPKNMDEMINVVVGRTLDLIGVEHDLFQRWGTSQRKCL